MVGTALARAVWPGKTEEFAKEVSKRRSDIFSYMIFLRVTPILPNTFINVVAPIVKLPLLPFILGKASTADCDCSHTIDCPPVILLGCSLL